MVNIQEIIGVLQINGISKGVPADQVKAALGQLNYQTLDQEKILAELSNLGWFGAAPVTPTMTPQPVVQIPTPAPVMYPSQKKSHVGILLTMIILVIVIAGGAYAYIEKIGPFAGSHFTEENFLSNVAKNIAGINSASYTLTGSLAVAPRDSDVYPFVLKSVSNTEALRKQYYNDSVRLKDVSSILSALRYSKTYPASLAALKASQNGFNKNMATTDPLTKKAYEYKTTQGGKDFALTITVETDAAVRAVTGATVLGKKITFTKASSSFLYLPSEPPKPYIVRMSESLSYLPPDISAKLGLTVSVKPSTETLPDWKSNVNAEGNFGDLAYKVNVDALKKSTDYYIKINNIPSIAFLGDLSAYKGKWINLTSKETSNSYSPFASVKSSLPRAEAQYKANRERSVKFITAAIALAESEKLITFKSQPKSDSVGGVSATRYELSLRKEAIVPFYKKLQTELAKDPELNKFNSSIDQGLVEYLQSQEFTEVYNYIEKHNSTFVWIDGAGYPIKVEMVSRVVPPDSAPQLKGKQANISLSLQLSDINKDIDIITPKDAVSIDSITSSYDRALDSARTKGKSAAVKANMNTIRSAAEIVYDKTPGGYGKAAFPLGPCKATPNTLFADPTVLSLIKSATDNTPSKATCVSTMKAGKVTEFAISAPLPDEGGYSFCIDSTGYVSNTLGELTSVACR